MIAKAISKGLVSRSVAGLGSVEVLVRRCWAWCCWGASFDCWSQLSCGTCWWMQGRQDSSAGWWSCRHRSAMSSSHVALRQVLRFTGTFHPR